MKKVVQSQAAPGELTEAVKRNDIKAVENLLQRGAEIHGDKILNRDMLNLAAELGHAEIAGLLFDNGAEIDKKGPGGLTPLMQAVRSGHIETARLLVERGANVALRTFDGPNGNATIGFANGYPELRKMLEEAPELQRRRAAEAEARPLQAFHAAVVQKQQRLKVHSVKPLIRGLRP